MVEILCPLEGFAINTVPSCFGNDNWKKKTKQILSLLFFDPFKMQNETMKARLSFT